MQVHHNGHFVLVVGYDSDPQMNSTFYVNDPFYKVDSYQYEEMTDLILYKVA